MQKLMKTLGLSILFVIIILLLKMFIDTDIFKIKEITIHGESNLIKAYITEKIENLKEKNIIYLNTNEIETLLEKDIRVKKIKIRKIYPSKLIIDLEERTPYVYVKNGDNIFLADENLNLFGNINETETKNIPVVVYNGDESEKKDLKIIISKIKNKDLYNIISEVRREQNYYNLILNNEIIIITDTLVSEKKYDRAYKLYEQEIKDKKVISCMDIRFNDIIVK